MSADIVKIGEHVPRTHFRFAQWLARRLLRWAGWRLEVQLPDEPKMVVLAAPHTSNWDGYYAIVSMVALNLRLGLFVKHSMFRWPFRGLLNTLGAIPINRTAAGGLVGQTVQAFHDHPQLLIGLAPEGTRGRVQKWKRGFYLIALEAQVPIVCAYLDYQRRVTGIGLVLNPTGDYAADLEKIQAFYRTITPRRPENFSARG
ncbi:MAG: lysophospholipid acyltransferase family protein [Pseudomonadota bacterium]